MAFEQYLPQPPNYQLVESENLWLDLLGTSNPEVVEDPEQAEEGEACLIRGIPSAIHKTELVQSRKKVDGKIVYFSRKVSHYFQLSEPDELGRKFITLSSSFSDQL
jgi:hypothetical protein